MTAGISLIRRKTGAHRSCERIRNEGELEPQKAQKAQESYVLLVLFVVSSSCLPIHSHLDRAPLQLGSRTIPEFFRTLLIASPAIGGTAQSNYVLAARSSVPIAHSTGRGAMEFSSGCHHHLEDVVAAAWGEFCLNLFRMRLPVRAGVEPGNEQTFVFLSATVLRACCQHNQAQQPSSN